MSSWERARFIPWSRIPQGEAGDVSSQKERIFRQLQREADQQEKEVQAATKMKNEEGQSLVAPSNTLQSSSATATTTTTTTTIDTNANAGMFNSPYKFKWMELFKNAAFGGTIGAITGSAFGFMDGMRTAQQNQVLMNASNVAKGRYLMQGTTRSATIFGVFFGGFHTLRYGIRVAADPGDWGEIGLAGAVSLGALMTQPAFRASLPYATMLIFMDGIHIVMRQFNDD